MRKWRVAFSGDYSTQKAINLLYKLHTESDESMSEIEEEMIVQDLLADACVNDPYFLISDVDWSVVRPTVLMMLNEFSDKIKI